MVLADSAGSADPAGTVRSVVSSGTDAVSQADIRKLEKAAYAYFFQLRWPEGFVCPRCGFKGAYTVRTRRLPLYQCQMCSRQTTLTAGTILENTRTALSKWRTTIELVSQPGSVNAVQLSSLLNVTYKTAFAMLKKIRMALTAVDHGRRLAGSVQAGFYQWNMTSDTIIHWNAARLYAVIAGAFDRKGRLVDVKIKPADPQDGGSRYKQAIRAFADAHVDGDFRSLQAHGPCRLKKVACFPPLIRRLRNWMNAAFRGVSRRYMEHYFDEFAFRANRSFHPGRASADLGPILMSNPPAFALRACPTAAITTASASDITLSA